MEIEIQTYLNTHRCDDNIIFTWCLYNYDKLKPTILDNDRLYFNEKVFTELKKVAFKDKFIELITCHGKFRACDKSNCNVRHNIQIVKKDNEIDWYKP